VPDAYEETSTLSLPIGVSFEFPATFTANEVNSGFWIRNYCSPSIWLGAVWEERSDAEAPFIKENFLDEIKEQRMTPALSNRFVPTENSSRVLDSQQAYCVKSNGRLEERSTQDSSVIITRTESGEVACIHPTKNRVSFRLFYYVADDSEETLSPQQRLGERFLDSLEIVNEDN
jgi:hypothetical protein